MLNMQIREGKEGGEIQEGRCDTLPRNKGRRGEMLLPMRSKSQERIFKYISKV